MAESRKDHEDMRNKTWIQERKKAKEEERKAREAVCMCVYVSTPATLPCIHTYRNTKDSCLQYTSCLQFISIYFLCLCLLYFVEDVEICFRFELNSDRIRWRGQLRGKPTSKRFQVYCLCLFTCIRCIE